MFRFLAVSGLVLSLAACATLQTKPREPQLVGKVQGDTIETIPTSAFRKPVTVISVVRTFDEAGALNVCGALVIAGPKEGMDEMLKFVDDGAAQLVIGEGGDKPIILPPRFMRLYTIETATGYDARQLNYDTLNGACLATDAPWRPEYKTAHKLNLRKTERRR